MNRIEIRDAAPADLVAGADLLAACLGFGDRDAIPPWLMQTAVAGGGIALGAFDGERLVAFSFALPTDDRSLFSCGLAVAPGHRGRHIARRLKLAQRDRALTRGLETIRWTADPLAAPALAVYLSGLGARLRSYEPELYAQARPDPVPPDDVVIRWDLHGARPVDAATCRRVEVPFSRAGMPMTQQRRWRLRVRELMCRALDDGLVGAGVTFDRAARRSWVLFAREA